MDKPDGFNIDQSFFSVGIDLIVLDEKIPYDLYINSSSLETRERFVRIFPRGENLNKTVLAEFKKKYFQIYIPESQRGAYLNSLVNSSEVGDTEKTEIIKDSAIVYLDKIFEPGKEFTTELLTETVSGCRESVISMMDVIKGYDVTDVQKLIGNLSYHDFYTYDHSINVSMYSIALYQAYEPKANKQDVLNVGLGGLLHDLGKTKIPTEIINNPDKLTDSQFNEIKKHPSLGRELLSSEVENNKELADIDFSVIKRIIFEHHENVNGTGYPSKLKGDEIHIMAKVVAICDFFDALTTKRSYHEVLSTEDALAIMEKSVDKKIDRKLFKAFTSKVKGLVLSGTSRVELGDDFDPCQPHQELPFEKVKAQKKDHNLFEKENNFGTVKTEDPKKNKDKKAS